MSNKDKEIEKLNKEIEKLELEKKVLELQKEVEELKKENPNRLQIPEIIRIPIVIPECPPKPCPRREPEPYYPIRPGEPTWIWDPYKEPYVGDILPDPNISICETSKPIRYNESQTSDKIPEQPRYTCFSSPIGSSKVNFKCEL